MPLSNLPVFQQCCGTRPSSDQIKRRVNASHGFRSFAGAWRTIQGYEVLHMIRKGQVRWLPKGDLLGQIQFDRDYPSVAGTSVTQAWRGFLEAWRGPRFR